MPNQTVSKKSAQQAPAAIPLRPRISLQVVCPDCGFDLNRLEEINLGLNARYTERFKRDTATGIAAGYRCDSCGFAFAITFDDLQEVQHRLLVALGEA